MIWGDNWIRPLKQPYTTNLQCSKSNSTTAMSTTSPRKRKPPLNIFCYNSTLDLLNSLLLACLRYLLGKIAVRRGALSFLIRYKQFKWTGSLLKTRFVYKIDYQLLQTREMLYFVCPNRRRRGIETFRAVCHDIKCEDDQLWLDWSRRPNVDEVDQVPLYGRD